MGDLSQELPVSAFRLACRRRSFRAAATVFLAGANMSTTVFAADDGHCIGANACKGQSACKGGNHACKGQNACKGQGFAEMTKADCVAAKGKFKAS
jgi:hypothetical protein